MENNSEIPTIIDEENLPFVLCHPALVYWIGVFIPLAGILLESVGVKYAFVASGAVLGPLVLALSMAARHCSKISQFANEAARDAARKQSENYQAAMNARNLMRQANDAGDLELLTKLVETVNRCDTRDSDFKETEADARAIESKFSLYDNELSDTAWAFGIIGVLVSGLGVYLRIPNI